MSFRILKIFLTRKGETEPHAEAYVEENDIFNGKMQEIVNKGRVDGYEEIPINELRLKDDQYANNNFPLHPDLRIPQTHQYKFSAQVIVPAPEDGEDYYKAAEVKIDNLVKFVNCGDKHLDGDEWIIRNCKLSILYKSKVTLKEIDDEEDDEQ